MVFLCVCGGRMFGMMFVRVVFSLLKGWCHLIV